MGSLSVILEPSRLVFDHHDLLVHRDALFLPSRFSFRVLPPTMLSIAGPSRKYNRSFVGQRPVLQPVGNKITPTMGGRIDQSVTDPWSLIRLEHGPTLLTSRLKLPWILALTYHASTISGVTVHRFGDHRNGTDAVEISRQVSGHPIVTSLSTYHSLSTRRNFAFSSKTPTRTRVCGNKEMQ